MPESPRRNRLQRLLKYFALLVGIVILYVLFDFSFDLRPPQIHSSYQFKIARLAPDKPVILHQDNLAVVVIRRSQPVISELRQTDKSLQDPDSKRSHQPKFATNSLRSRTPEYFVAYALGTDLGCLLHEIDGKLEEICGEARYDFAGRALKGNTDYLNLEIPEYNFTNNFNILTIKP